METYAGAPTISIFNYKNKKLFRIWANLNTQQQDNKVTKVSHLLSGQSSPGSLQSGQQPSNAILQIPQVSSWASHVHDATACHLQFLQSTTIMASYYIKNETSKYAGQQPRRLWVFFFIEKRKSS